MIAVIKASGKQYHIKIGDVIKIDKISGEVGDRITFDRILALYDDNKIEEAKLGGPFVKSAKVNAKILEQMKDKKVIVFKKKRRKNYRRKKGHRQDITILKILEIEGN